MKYFFWKHFYLKLNPLMVHLTKLIPGINSTILIKECYNKSQIIKIVLENKVIPQENISINTLIKQCYELGEYPALWALEAVGIDLVKFHIRTNKNLVNVLNVTTIDPQYRKSLLLIHAGIGYEISNYFISKINKKLSTQEVNHTVENIVNYCKINSNEIFLNIMINTFGFVTYFNGYEIYNKFYNALKQIASDQLHYFLQGCGRAIYFSAANTFPPKLKGSLINAFNLAKKKTIDPNNYQDLIIGNVVAFNLVNMHSPDVIAYALQNIEQLMNDEVLMKAYFIGFILSIVARLITTPDTSLLERYKNHQPQNNSQKKIWSSFIQKPIDYALKEIMPLYKQTQSYEQIIKHVYEIEDILIQVQRL